MIPPQIDISLHAIKGKLSLLISNSGSTILERTFLEFGPAIAICAHASVVEIRCTSISGHKHWWQNSKCLYTLSALAVVVVIMKWFSLILAVVPSSITRPSSLNINP